MEPILIDINGLLHRTMNDPEFAKEILNDYLDETPQMIISLQEAVKLVDLQSIQDLSHKIKGSSASIGALKVKLKSELIENMAKVDNITNIDEILLDFIESYNKTINSIKKLEIMK